MPVAELTHYSSLNISVIAAEALSSKSPVDGQKQDVVDTAKRSLEHIAEIYKFSVSYTDFPKVKIYVISVK